MREGLGSVVEAVAGSQYWPLAVAMCVLAVVIGVMWAAGHAARWVWRHVVMVALVVGAAIVMWLAPGPWPWVAAVVAVGVLVGRMWRARTRRRRRKGVAVSARQLRRWAQAAPAEDGHEYPVDERYRAVAARCQGDAWPEAMVAMGLARKATGDDPGAWEAPQGDAWWRFPHVVSMVASATGATIRVALLEGQGPSDVERCGQAIASHLRVPRVEVAADAHDALHGSVTVRARWLDPLAGTRHTGQSTTEIEYGRVLVGRLEDGNEAVWAPAAASHIIIQGATRGGKSAAAYNLLSQAFHYPFVRVAGIDPSQVLLGPLEDYGDPWVWTDGDLSRTVEILEEVIEVMNERLKTLRPNSIDKWENFTSDDPLIVFVLEEYAGFISKLKRDDAKRGRKPADRLAPAAEDLIGRLVSESAKVGIRVFLVTQRATADIIDSTTRGQIVTRATFPVEEDSSISMLHPDATPEQRVQLKMGDKGRMLWQDASPPLLCKGDLMTYRAYVEAVGGRPADTMPWLASPETETVAVLDDEDSDGTHLGEGETPQPASLPMGVQDQGEMATEKEVV